METLVTFFGVLSVLNGNLANFIGPFRKDSSNNVTTLFADADLNKTSVEHRATFGETFGFKQEAAAIADNDVPEGFVLPTNFVYTINEPDLCHRYGQPYIISYVHSKPSHFDNRRTIRNTWANPKYFSKLGIVTFFVLGDPAENFSNFTVDAVHEESKTYGDIIMTDFIDSHINLTYKNLAGMRWIHQYCLRNVSKQLQPRYVLKADDDVFIDSFRLVRLMRYLERINFREDLGDTSNEIPATMRKTFYGYTKTCNQAIRDKTNRYYLSYKAFPEKWFPGTWLKQMKRRKI